jgi:hypothetical protein
MWFVGATLSFIDHPKSAVADTSHLVVQVFMHVDSNG